MAGEYEKHHVLGSGTFGKAWLATIKSSKKQCVLKEIKVSEMSKKEIDQTITEVTVLARCKHENIIRYTSAFVENGSLYIAMEYAETGDIGKKIVDQRGILFSEHVILTWFVQINMALCYIHSRNILHRDLKPQNIFLTNDDTVKLGDFGIARVLRDKNDLAMTMIGTPYYLSPEICQKQPYNHKSDMWALGCVLYELCCLRVPFSAPDFTSLVMTILSGCFEPIPRHYGPLLEDLVGVLLRTNPDNRPTSEQILCIPTMQPYVLEYTRNLNRAICEKKRRLVSPNIDIMNTAKKEKREGCCNKQHGNHDHPVTIQPDKKAYIEKEVDDTNVDDKPRDDIQLDENQNEVERKITDENDNDVCKEKKKDVCCTPERNVKKHFDSHKTPPRINTPENCGAAADCYCIENPKKRRQEAISPHMKDIIIKQRAAFSCAPGMKLNVGNQGIGPAPVFSLFSSVRRPAVRSESDQSRKIHKPRPFSMAQELMARKNTNVRSKSMSRITTSDGKLAEQDVPEKVNVDAPNGSSNRKLSKSVDDLTDNNASEDLNFKAAESKAVDSIAKISEESNIVHSTFKSPETKIIDPTFKMPGTKAAESCFKTPGRKSSVRSDTSISTGGSNSSVDSMFKTPKTVSPTNMDDSGCSEEDVFTTGVNLFKDPTAITPAIGSQGSIGSCGINSATFRVPLDKPRLSVPVVDMREECVINEQNIKVLYRATLESTHCKNRALTTLTLYLQEKLGAAFFQHLYSLFKEAINTRMDYDILKCRMRKSVVYLPLFVEIMRIENHLPVGSR